MTALSPQQQILLNGLAHYGLNDGNIQGQTIESIDRLIPQTDRLSRANAYALIGQLAAQPDVDVVKLKNIVYPALGTFCDPNGNYVGHGFFVSPHTIITCVHVIAAILGEDSSSDDENFTDVVEEDQHQNQNQIQTRKRNSWINQRVSMHMFHSNANIDCIVISANSACDVAVLRSEIPVGNNYEVYNHPHFLGSNYDEHKELTDCYLLTYSIGLNDELNYQVREMGGDGTAQFYHSVQDGKISIVTNKFFVHTTKAHGGDSGCPVVLRNGNVIGIHLNNINRMREYKKDLDSDSQAGSMEGSLISIISDPNNNFVAGKSALWREIVG
eukprot:c16574_g2_i1.p1 GENE.c16574_g2_i1~~c16574_g2_i1.p1  ORF type:complete len:328 (+),score=39.36 c16574_g2_i1:90-1073(+)